MALKHRQQLPQASPLLVPSKVLDLGCWSGVATMSHSWLMPKAQPSVLNFLPLFWISWPCSHLLPYSCGAYSIILIFWRLSVRTACKVPLTTSLFNRQSGGFIKFLKRILVSSSGDLSDSSNLFNSSPRPFVCLSFPSYSNGFFFVEL